MENLVFGLDIGTRSIIGLVGRKTLNGFEVIGDAMVLHETRSMIDGQIHDIHKVAETIKKVKQLLEDQVGFVLTHVNIAAAGRVLKTCQVHVSQELDPNQAIDEDRIFSLELLGIEKAHQDVLSQLTKSESGMHCVGYTVSKYYLNGYEISKLSDHKGKTMGADVLATFLPKEVVESLYQVVSLAGLEVDHLTLEPIAAIDVAIPERFRLLNLALVDIGAGTSDIAITKDGSVVAYGMIPVAGDEITETLVHHYLIDFKTAEKLKIKTSGRSKTASFKDILGQKHSVEIEAVRSVLQGAMVSLAGQIAEKIKTLNNGVSTNAVFVVGGGGQLTGFDTLLAEALGLNSDRVGLRGKEVLDAVTFKSGKKKGPDLVTPVGICYTGLKGNQHDFVEVYFNDQPVKVFNANKITVMDIAAFKGYDPKRLLVTRGTDLVFTLDGVVKTVKGDTGVPPQIRINQQVASMSDPVLMNDYITIVDAKRGDDGSLSLNQLKGMITPYQLVIQSDPYEIMPHICINGIMVLKHQMIRMDDVVETIPPTIQEAFEVFRIHYNKKPIKMNGRGATLETPLEPKAIIEFEATSQTTSVDATQTQVQVLVNKIPVTLTGKKEYLFVDIFDYIDFDRTRPKGILVAKINQEKANFMDPIHNQDVIEVYWQNPKA